MIPKEPFCPAAYNRTAAHITAKVLWTVVASGIWTPNRTTVMEFISFQTTSCLGANKMRQCHLRILMNDLMTSRHPCQTSRITYSKTSFLNTICIVMEKSFTRNSNVHPVWLHPGHFTILHADVFLLAPSVSSRGRNESAKSGNKTYTCLYHVTLRICSR